MFKKEDDVFFSDKNLSKLVEKDFDIGLQKMHLIDSDNDNKILLEGSGWIIQKDTNFIYRMIITKSNIDSKEVKWRIDNNNDYYRFVGYDSDSNKWKFKTTSFVYNELRNLEVLTEISGNFESIECYESEPNNGNDNLIAFGFLDYYKFPFNKVEKTEIKNENGRYREHIPHISFKYKNISISGYKKDNIIILNFVTGN